MSRSDWDRDVWVIGLIVTIGLCVLLTLEPYWRVKSPSAASRRTNAGSDSTARTGAGPQKATTAEPQANSVEQNKSIPRPKADESHQNGSESGAQEKKPSEQNKTSKPYFEPLSPELRGWWIVRFFAILAAGVTGTVFAYRQIRLSMEKGVGPDRERVTALWSGVGGSEGPKPISPKELGYFNARAFNRDPRLIYRPHELEERHREENRPSTTFRFNKGPKKLTPPPELMQPEYAIGKGVITSAEVQSLKDDYLAQGELFFGLILPLMFLVFVLSNQERFGFEGWEVSLMVLGLILATALCCYWGLERRHKYRMELKLLILGHWDKLIEKPAPRAPTAPKPDLADLRKAVSEELSKMHMQVRPLVVELRQTSQTEGQEPSPEGQEPTEEPGGEPA